MEVSGVLVLFHFILHQNTCVFGGSMDPAESFGSSPILACFFVRNRGWVKISFSPLVAVRERKLVSENFHLALARHAERVRWTRAKVPVFGSFAGCVAAEGLNRSYQCAWFAVPRVSHSLTRGRGRSTAALVVVVWRYGL